MNRFWICLILFAGMFACDTEDHYDRDPSQGGTSSTGGTTTTGSAKLCSVGDSQICTTADGLSGLQYCYDDGSFGRCWPKTSSTTTVSTGGSPSQTTTSSSTGGSVSPSTGGVTSTQTSNTGGSSSVTNCVSGWLKRCVTSSSQDGYQTCLTNGTWGLCVASTTTVSCTDCDSDGESATTDCNDQNASMSHNRSEICGNQIDDDCDGMQDCTDPECSSLSSCQIDVDGDGEKATTDCNDQNAAISHNHAEVCGNGNVDDDCDGLSECEDPDCHC